MVKRKLGTDPDDWESPSPFTKLLKGLKKSSKRLGKDKKVKKVEKPIVQTEQKGVAENGKCMLRVTVRL